MIDNIQRWCPTLDNNNISAQATDDTQIVVKVEPVSVMDEVKVEETVGRDSDSDATFPTRLNNDLVTDETDGDILVENVQ